MRHRVSSKQFNRSADHRKAMYRNMVSSLVKHGFVRTTLPKAKAIRPEAEKIITRAKSNDLAARRALLSYFYEKTVAEKVLNEVGPLFKTRPGGYLRIVKLGKRLSDNTEMARLEFVETLPSNAPKAKPKKAVVKGVEKVVSALPKRASRGSTKSKASETSIDTPEEPKDDE